MLTFPRSFHLFSFILYTLPLFMYTSHIKLTSQEYELESLKSPASHLEMRKARQKLVLIFFPSNDMGLQ